MDSDKEFVYCGKGILERIKEEDIFKGTIKPYIKENLINHLKEMFDNIPEHKKK